MLDAINMAAFAMLKPIPIRARLRLLVSGMICCPDFPTSRGFRKDIVWEYTR